MNVQKVLHALTAAATTVAGLRLLQHIIYPPVFFSAAQTEAILLLTNEIPRESAEIWMCFAIKQKQQNDFRVTLSLDRVTNLLKNENRTKVIEWLWRALMYLVLSDANITQAFRTCLWYIISEKYAHVYYHTRDTSRVRRWQRLCEEFQGDLQCPDSVWVPFSCNVLWQSITAVHVNVEFCVEMARWIHKRNKGILTWCGIVHSIIELLKLHSMKPHLITKPSAVFHALCSEEFVHYDGSGLNFFVIPNERKLNAIDFAYDYYYDCYYRLQRPMYQQMKRIVDYITNCLHVCQDFFPRPVSEMIFQYTIDQCLVRHYTICMRSEHLYAIEAIDHDGMDD